MLIDANLGKGRARSQNNCKNVKRKFLPRTRNEGPKTEQKNSSTLSLTSALDGGGWLAPRPDPFCRRPGGLQVLSGRVQKISLPPEFESRTVQLIQSRCTNYATPAQ